MPFSRFCACLTERDSARARARWRRRAAWSPGVVGRGGPRGVRVGAPIVGLGVGGARGGAASCKRKAASLRQGPGQFAVSYTRYIHPTPPFQNSQSGFFQPEPQRARACTQTSGRPYCNPARCRRPASSPCACRRAPPGSWIRPSGCVRFFHTRQMPILPSKLWRASGRAMAVSTITLPMYRFDFCRAFGFATPGGSLSLTRFVQTYAHFSSRST